MESFKEIYRKISCYDAEIEVYIIIIEIMSASFRDFRCVRAVLSDTQGNGLAGSLRSGSFSYVSSFLCIKISSFSEACFEAFGEEEPG